eukprot:COSAG01_NODE_2809_length_7041_cov_4.383751_4_plen_76_part_00
MADATPVQIGMDPTVTLIICLVFGIPVMFILFKVRLPAPERLLLCLAPATYCEPQLLASYCQPWLRGTMLFDSFS